MTAGRTTPLRRLPAIRRTRTQAIATLRAAGQVDDGHALAIWLLGAEPAEDTGNDDPEGV